MDWLARRQDAIEAGLAAATWAAGQPRAGWRGSPVQFPGGGPMLPLARPGYSRDGKKAGCRSSTAADDPEGRPVAVVFPGNTGDPTAFTEIVTVVRDKSGLQKMVMAGDRGHDHQRPHPPP